MRKDSVGGREKPCRDKVGGKRNGVEGIREGERLKECEFREAAASLTQGISRWVLGENFSYLLHIETE